MGGDPQDMGRLFNTSIPSENEAVGGTEPATDKDGPGLYSLHESSTVAEMHSSYGDAFAKLFPSVIPLPPLKRIGTLVPAVLGLLGIFGVKPRNR